MKTILANFDNLEDIQIEALQGLIADLPSCTGIEILKNSIAAYFEAEHFPKADLDEICNMLNISYQTSEMEDKNWNEVWESNFAPIEVGNFCYIKANFHPTPAKKYTHLLEITPKMSFGTGHHATTRQVMEAMQNIDFINKAVFDFGTGTGILAILAEKMGATKIIASDNDSWSIENSLENVSNNHCKHIVVTGDDVTLIAHPQTFDIILANINRHILLEYIQILSRSLKPDGQLILSGILREDINIIEKELNKWNLKVIRNTNLNNWVCLLAEHAF
jgi:ribosomal protein L11 methyltransferase